jgi:hypothetical protein
MTHLFVRHGDLYQSEISQVVALFEKHSGVQLLFGSSHSDQPSYNYGGDGCHFHNLSPQQAELIKAALVVKDIAEGDIEISDHSVG